MLLESINYIVDYTRRHTTIKKVVKQRARKATVFKEIYKHACILSFMLGSQLTDCCLTLNRTIFQLYSYHECMIRIAYAISGAGKMYCYDVPINGSFH